MKKIFISCLTADDMKRGHTEMGYAHYSYKITKGRMEKVLGNLGFEVRELVMPELYKHKMALRRIMKEGEKSVHLIYKPPEEIRILKGAYNIVVFAWEFSKMVEFDVRRIPTFNQQRMLRNVDELWVPCWSTKKAAEASGVSAEKVYVIPAYIPTSRPTRPSLRKSLAELLEGLNYVSLESIVESKGKGIMRFNYRKCCRNIFSYLYQLLRITDKLIDALNIVILKRLLYPVILFRAVRKSLVLLKKLLLFILSPFEKSSPVEIVSCQKSLECEKGKMGEYKLKMIIKNVTKRALCTTRDYPLFLSYKLFSGGKELKHHNVARTPIRQVLLPADAHEVEMTFNYTPNMPQKNFSLQPDVILEGFKWFNLHSQKVEVRVKDRPEKFKHFDKIYVSVLNPLDERKDLENLLTSFIFFNQRYPRALLILKLIIDNKTITMDKHVQQLVSKILRPYRLSNIHFNILLLWDYLSPEDYNNLIALADYYYCVSKGEGQCLPILEAMGLGVVPVSVSNTAMEDYINSENSIVIKSYKEPWGSRINKQAGNMSMTYRVDWEDAVSKLGQSYNLPRKIFQQKSNLCKKTINEQYSLEAISRLVSERFDILRKEKNVTV